MKKKDTGLRTLIIQNVSVIVIVVVTLLLGSIYVTRPVSNVVRAPNAKIAEFNEEQNALQLYDTTTPIQVCTPARKELYGSTTYTYSGDCMDSKELYRLMKDYLEARQGWLKVRLSSSDTNVYFGTAPNVP